MLQILFFSFLISPFGFSQNCTLTLEDYTLRRDKNLLTRKVIRDDIRRKEARLATLRTNHPFSQIYHEVERIEQDELIPLSQALQDLRDKASQLDKEWSLCNLLPDDSRSVELHP